MDGITNLAHVLLENGDKILNGSSKLSVNASLLQKIGAELNSIMEENKQQCSSTFEVLSTSHGQSKTIDHLQFLHDFFQKTSGLKLVNNANLLDNNAIIDISKFKKLKYLELQRVPIKQLIGLKVVQHQIECLVCERGLSALEHLLAECGGDKSTGFVWSELTEAVLSFNTIKIVDSSVAFAPRLQVLDLSHNQIFDVNAIERLPNLKYVNLSFNSLTEIPSFNKSAKKRMEVLVLKNNFIENLIPLNGLDSLRELDLSNNMICCCQNFQPFLSMATLHLLSISGNPISVIQSYRLSVVKCLHISASFGDFILDGAALTKKEKEHVGAELLSQRPFNSTIDTPAPTALPEVQVSIPKPRKKSGKMRLVVIPNFDGTYDLTHPEISDIPVSAPKTDHLKTKALIQEARNTHKENWLRSDCVQEILGLPRISLSSTPYDDSCLLGSLKISESNTTPTPPNNVITTTAVIEHRAPVQTTTAEISQDSFLSCNEIQGTDYFSFDSEGDIKNKEMSPDIETIVESDEELDHECQKHVYVATRLIKEGSEIQREELFISVSNLEIRELDVARGRTIGLWSFASLESATKINDREIHLIFSTLRRDRRERIYEMEKNEATDFVQFCRIQLETLAGSKLISFKCVTCLTVFSVDKIASRKGVNTACPTCGSYVVLQADDSPITENKQIISESVQVDKKHSRSASVGLYSSIKKSPSFSSIGSAVSFDEHNIAPLKITMTGLEKTEKRSDSDIEIISNPSLSSIEVIDAPAKLEPLEVVYQDKLANPTISAFAAGLTESSSSGSITDSICTAYENSSMVSSGVSKKSTMENSTLFEEQSYDALTKKSMEGDDFDNLLKDVLIKVSHKIPRKVRESGEDKDIDLVEYSYTKFDELDHRIKLYVYQNVFTDNAEQLIFLIRCQLLHINDDSPFEACVVSSNKKIYILRITNKEEGEEASKFLQRVDNMSFNLSVLTKWETLPWNQGFQITTKETQFLIFVGDSTRTLNFLSFVKSLDLPQFSSNCDLKKGSESATNLQLIQFMMSCADDPAVLSAICFHKCSIQTNLKRNEIFLGACLFTPTDLFIVDSVKWMFNSTKFNFPVPTSSQKLSSLMQVSVEDKQLKFQFLREAEGLQEIWSFTFASQLALEHVINIISSPWEHLFSVPLQVDYDQTDTFFK